MSHHIPTVSGYYECNQFNGAKKYKETLIKSIQMLLDGGTKILIPKGIFQLYGECREL